MEDTIAWSAPTHMPSERSTDWYWAVGLIAIFGIVVSILLNDAIFAVVIALSAACLFTLALRTPRECEIHLTKEGILIDHDFHPYRSLRTFWVFEDHHKGPRLLLTSAGILHPHISLSIHAPADSTRVRAYLRRYIPEEEKHSPGSMLIELLGL